MMGNVPVRSYAILLLAGAVSFSQKVNSQEKPIIAVFQMEDRGSGLSRNGLENLTTYLSTKLAEGGYQIIPQNQIKDRIAQQKRETHRECYDQSCQIDLGKELAAQKSLSTQLMKIGKSCQLTATMYDLKKATAEQAATARGACEEDDLLGAIDQMAQKLCLSLTAGKGMGKTDLDRALRGAQELVEKKESMKKTWETVSQLANNLQIPLPTRIDVLQKFLQEYQVDNPFREKAFGMLADLLPAKLVITSDPPGAQVKANEAAIGQTGQTPLIKAIRAGKYRIAAELKGYIPDLREVTLDPGQEVQVTLQLKDVRLGVLAVTASPPGATASIFLGEKRLESIAVPFNKELAPGQYSVLTTLAGFTDQRKNITLQRGKLLSVTFILEKLPPGNLVIKTIPPGAVINVAREGHGTSDLGTSPLTAKLEPGEYEITAMKDGYKEDSRKVTLQTSSSTEVSLSLERKKKMHPLIKWGHIVFWSGLGMGGFGAMAAVFAKKAADDEADGNVSSGSKSRAWAGMMYVGLGSGVALITTGVVLWLRGAPFKNSQDDQVASILPRADGFVVALHWGW